MAELEHTLSASELHEWLEYYEMEPFHADRSEVQLATMSHMMNAFMGGSAKATDFMLTYKEKKKDSLSGLAAKVKAIFGGGKNG
ncbi:hypothetical protein [Sulfurimonas sp. HSL-1716]|uniref:phage tail assembly protein T n=1 Tax=Hydrocurvibacter sulfurireducens TaxID=3131937 RepID=UPI0031F7D563